MGKCICPLIRGPKVTAATSSLAPKSPLFLTRNYNTENGVSAVCVVVQFYLAGQWDDLFINKNVCTCQCGRHRRHGGSIPGSGRSPGGGHGNPLQDACLENPMDTRAWRATVRGVAKSRSDTTEHAHREETGKERRKVFFHLN